MEIRAVHARRELTAHRMLLRAVYALRICSRALEQVAVHRALLAQHPTWYVDLSLPSLLS
jgi:hypothetical protein